MKRMSMGAIAAAMVLGALPGGLVAMARPAVDRAVRVADTFVTHNCEGAKTRPGKIIFSCPDEDFYVKHMEWGRWLKKKARGHGQFRLNDCTPNCDESEVLKRKGRLTLLNRPLVRGSREIRLPDGQGQVPGAVEGTQTGHRSFVLPIVGLWRPRVAELGIA